MKCIRIGDSVETVGHHRLLSDEGVLKNAAVAIPVLILVVQEGNVGVSRSDINLAGSGAAKTDVVPSRGVSLPNDQIAQGQIGIAAIPGAVKEIGGGGIRCPREGIRVIG